jgi:hypothetical protein
MSTARTCSQSKSTAAKRQVASGSSGICRGTHAWAAQREMASKDGASSMQMQVPSAGGGLLFAAQPVGYTGAHAAGQDGASWPAACGRWQSLLSPSHCSHLFFWVCCQCAHSPLLQVSLSHRHLHLVLLPLIIRLAGQPRPHTKVLLLLLALFRTAGPLPFLLILLITGLWPC